MRHLFGRLLCFTALLAFAIICCTGCAKSENESDVSVSQPDGGSTRDADVQMQYLATLASLDFSEGIEIVPLATIDGKVLFATYLTNAENEIREFRSLSLVDESAAIEDMSAYRPLAQQMSDETAKQPRSIIIAASRYQEQNYAVIEEVISTDKIEQEHTEYYLRTTLPDGSVADSTILSYDGEFIVPKDVAWNGEELLVLTDNEIYRADESCTLTKRQTVIPDNKAPTQEDNVEKTSQEVLTRFISANEERAILLTSSNKVVDFSLRFNASKTLHELNEADKVLWSQASIPIEQEIHVVSKTDIAALHSDAEKEVLLPLSDLNINASDIVCIGEYESSSSDLVYYGVVNDKNFKYYEVFVLRKTAVPKQHAIELTVGTTSAPESLERAAKSFNSEQANTRVSIKEYESPLLLREALRSSELDLVITNGLSYDDLTLNNLLLSLDGFMQADAKYSKNNYLGNIPQLLTLRNHIYEISENVKISTLLSSKTQTGTREYWNLNDLYAFRENTMESKELFSDGSLDPVDAHAILLQFYAEDLKSSVKRKLMKNYLVETAQFFSNEKEVYKQDFNTLDEVAKAIISHKVALTAVDFSDIADFNIYNSYFGENMAIIGYPHSKIAPGNLATFINPIAIAANTQFPYESWTFVKKFLAESEWEGIPTRTDTFEALESALKGENAELSEQDIENIVFGAEQLSEKVERLRADEGRINNLTAETVEKVKNLIASCEYVYDAEWCVV